MPVDAGAIVSRGGPDGTSQAILDAAQRLFLQAGYEGVNLDQVGRAAGVTRQTVYNQFGSKDAVFRAVMERHWEAIRTETAALFPLPAETQADPEAVLRGFARALLRFVRDTDQIAFTRLVIAESRGQPWIADAFYRAGKEPVLKAFATVLSDLTRTGLLACERPEVAAHQFLGLVQEFVIWPHVMSIGDGLQALPSDADVVEEAIGTFMHRYRPPR